MRLPKATQGFACILTFIDLHIYCSRLLILLYIWHEELSMRHSVRTELNSNDLLV